MKLSPRNWLLVLALVAVPFVASAFSEGPGLSVQESLAKLVTGNSRFAAGMPQRPNQDAARRLDTFENGQHPFAVVLSCSDSRVPPEILFDQGVGDVFSIRVAGNVAATDEIGTIEYGVEHLGAPLLVVLGHTKCGAVTAVVKGEKVGGNIPALVAPIVPAAEKAKAMLPGKDAAEVVPLAIEQNIWQAIDDIHKNSPIVRDLVKAGKLTVVGGVYAIDEGTIQWLGKHPEQEKLLAYTGGPAGH